MAAARVGRALAFHGRRWRRDRRFEIQPSVRRHSFKNHYLQLLKNERLSDFVRHLPVLLAWEAARLGYALLRDHAVLGGYREALRLAPRAWHKRKLIAAKLRTRAPHGAPR